MTQAQKQTSGTVAAGAPCLEMHCESLGVTIGDTCIASDLNISISPGQYWGMLGANGAGKTTLLKHLAGLNQPLTGQVRLGEKTLEAWHRRELAKRLGMLQQHTAYVFDATVLQVALTGRHPYLGPFSRESAADHELAHRALESLDLGALVNRRVTSLSGGEARRLAFAALMVQNPDLMLLDEPTNHLDFRHQVSIMRTVGDLVYRNGKSAIAAIHDVNLAATYCSHVLLLYGEGKWEAGSATDLLTVDRLEALYQCPVTSVETAEGRRFHPAFSRD